MDLRPVQPRLLAARWTAPDHSKCELELARPYAENWGRVKLYIARALPLLKAPPHLCVRRITPTDARVPSPIYERIDVPAQPSVAVTGYWLADGVLEFEFRVIL